MKKSFLLQLIVASLFFCTVTALPVHTSGKSLKTTAGIILPGIPADTTITVTIVKIELPAKTVTLKDQGGKLYVFVVDTQVIDLSKLKVGQSVTATISTTILINRVTRAKITKQQLIKLQ